MSKCLMLAMSLHTPVMLDSVIKTEHLSEDGVISDSHITIVYDGNDLMEKNSLLDDVKSSIGESEYNVFNEFIRDSYKFRVGEVTYLDVFSNDDKSYLVLRLKEDNEMFSKLKAMHDYIVNKYGIHEDFPEFKPHITLASCQPGIASEYLDNKILNAVLNDSKLGFEDLVYSVDNEKGGYDKWNLTTYHALTRFFRETRVSGL